MQPSKVSITQLFAAGHSFYVPFYQRAYVWTEKLWSRFLHDMEYISKTEEEYFIGSVILKKLGANGIETARWSVVDGQQRLTTLAIFYKVLSLKNSTLHNPFDKRFRLDDSSLNIKHSLIDKEAFEKITNLTSDVYLENAENSNLIAAYNYFWGNVDINKINILNIQARLWFIAIYLESNENEHKIFDTINSIGMSLNTEELLKNHLFTSATVEDYNQIWKPIFEVDAVTLAYWKTEVAIVSSGKKTISDRFFHILLQIIMHDPRNNISSEDRAEFRIFNEEGQFNNYQKVIESGHWDKKEFAKEITDYARIFRQIFVRKEIQSAPDSYTTPLKRILFVVFTLDVYSALPFILYVLKNSQSQEENDKIFNLLESYIVRRQICNKVSKNYSDLFTEGLIGHQILNYNALRDFLVEKKPTESLHMPYDYEVEDGFLTNASLKSEKARGILYLLESELRKTDHCETVLRPFAEYTLEHLMPQSWEENWKMPELSEIEAIEFRAIRKQMICTLGNLGIITQGLNSKVSNSKWSKKLSQGLREKAADILTMKNVVNKSDWNEEQIKKRAEWLADKANEIWENVVSSDEQEETEVEIRRQLDHTKYSLDGGATYLFKGTFVPIFVKEYVRKHPDITIAELKNLFKDNYLKGFIRLGFICTEDEIRHKPLKNGRRPNDAELKRWYDIDKESAWITSGDGIKFVVSTEMTKHSADIVKGIAEEDGWVILTQSEK